MQYYLVDAFTDKPFSGNQAGICLVDQPLSARTMQQIAAENNLAETAFIFHEPQGLRLRWFTPEIEMDLCGHATLAAGYVVLQFVTPQADAVQFDTQSGLLTVTRAGDLLEMDLPARPPVPAPITPLMREAIGAQVLEAHRSRDLLLLVKDEDTVRQLRPNLQKLAAIPDSLGVVVTARGESCDFVSRYFAPGVDAGAPEDPVTGSTHCNLVPFWAERLHKQEFVARQLSRRGGTLYCRNCGERVRVAGQATLFLSGTIYLDALEDA